ncbi:MAG TPA: ABC transporter ATP-binding protein [Candidatus Dormibacteraeota bacterium]|jgi:ABC-2 type transport system ATP-binding protein|nr:ABC transporter ATP-binding protein [Candidatus Dormibacteraeota bacterium]
MTAAISVVGVSRRHRDHLALDAVSLQVEAGSITGLLGRNGAGKTTLMRIIAAQDFASAGEVRVMGADPVEDDAVLRRIVLVREDQIYPRYVRVWQLLRMASWCYPNWSQELAETLLRDFDLPAGRRVERLSRGMRSALGIVIGLAARTEVTLFDEPYAGLDAVARDRFYDRLLTEYTERPRAMILSTHLIDEIAGLLERVVVLHRGRVVLDAPTDDLRGSASIVSGPALAVDQFVAGRRTWDRRRIGSQASAIVVGPVTEVDAARARSLRLEVEALTLQQVVVRTAAERDASAEERTSA